MSTVSVENIDQTQAPEEADVLTAEELQYAPLEAKLREWSLSYTVERDFPIDKVNREASAQVRESVHLAPTQRVEEYAAQMRNGAAFPPILVRTPGNVLVDGNTRLAAAKRVGRKTFPAIMVDTKTEDMAKILAAAVNQMGGERLTATEAHEAALLMMGAGYQDSSIARELGRDPSQVRRWRSQRDVYDRAEKLGIGDTLRPIARTSVGKLADVRLDEPFKELTKLFADVQPTERQAKEMAAEVVQQSSESAALEAIAELREQLAPAGPPPHRATREIPLARAAIGNLLKFEGRPSAAFDPRKREEELERWQRISAVVAEVLTALKAVEDDRAGV